jgi:Galactosyltransferase
LGNEINLNQRKYSSKLENTIDSENYAHCTVFHSYIHYYIKMDRRSLISLFIGVTFFVSIWHLMLQQQQEQFYDTTFSSSGGIVLTSSISNDSFAFSNANNASIHMLFNLSSITSTEFMPKQDFNQLIDLYNFEFLMNPKTCKDLDHQPLVVILVHSAPNNFPKRQTIRDTWGQEDSRSLVLFLIGNVESAVLKKKLTTENELYGDLVQGNFDDAYRNMTYKHVMALKWFIYNCSNARFLLKTDDDVFVNSPLMYNILEKPMPPLERLQRGHLIYCYKIERAKVKRSYRSKWRVSFKEFSDKYFANHCPGFIILYSADVVHQLYSEAQKLNYFWIDDVHITGTVASKLNMSITPFRDMYLTKEQQKSFLEGNSQNSSFLFARPDLEEIQIRSLWRLTRGL